MIMGIIMVAMLAFGGTYAYFTASANGKSASLTVGTVENAYSDTIAAGMVCSQSTAAEAMLDVGAVVNIYVSMGPNPNPSPTPSPIPYPTESQTPTVVPEPGTEGENGDIPVVNPGEGTEGEPAVKPEEGTGDEPAVNPGGETGDEPVVNPGEGTEDEPVVNPGEGTDDEGEGSDEAEATPTPSPTPVGELKHRATVDITEFPFSDSDQVVDITLELVQGDVMITIYDEFGITQDDFMMDLASFSFELDDKRLSAGEANVYMYVDLVPSDTVYTVTLEAFYE
jgi:predicted ribosomally synthesized peptide with SipW-like signal peptide